MTKASSGATAQVNYGVTGDNFWIPTENDFKAWDVSLPNKTWTRTPVLTDNKTVRTITNKTFADTTVTDVAKLRLAVQFDIRTAPIKTYTVSFNLNGATGSIPDQYVPEGATAMEPAYPTWGAYTFGGWYKEAVCTNAFNFTTAITAPITLYAKWTQSP